MAVSPLTTVDVTAMANLASSANGKSSFTDKPFRFLPPVRAFETKPAMLRWWGAENGGFANVALGFGGIAVIRSEQTAYQLASLPHTVEANWAPASNFFVWTGDAAPTGAAGAFGYNFRQLGEGIRRWSVTGNRWESYLGWRGELRRLRSQCFSNIFPNLLTTVRSVERDGAWYVEPPLQTFGGLWSDEVFPWATGNTWSPFGFRHDFFKAVRYVYADNGTPTTVDSVGTLSASMYGLRVEGANLKHAVFRLKGRFGDGNIPLLTFSVRIGISRALPGAGTIPGYQVINQLGLTVTEATFNDPIFGPTRTVTFSADLLAWDGTQSEFGIDITGGFVGDLYEINPSALSGTIRFRREVSSTAEGIHAQFPLKQITLPDTPENVSPPWVWFQNANSGISDPAPQGAEIWYSAITGWLATPSGVTDGVWMARPLPLSNVEFEDQAETLLAGSLIRPILHRYARAASIASPNWPTVAEDTNGLILTAATDSDYEVSRVLMFQMPPVYIREVTEQSTQAEMDYQRKLYMYGSKQQHNWRFDLVHRRGMIYSVTARRMHDPLSVQVPQYIGTARTISIGYLFGGTNPGNYRHLISITIPADQEKVTIYPRWPILDGTSLAFQCEDPVAVFATIMPFSPGSSKAMEPSIIDVFDSGRVTPIMAFHYNDTEKMLGVIG